MRDLIGDRAFYRKIIRILVPMLVQYVITNFVNLLDNLMVGQVGTEPMSGVAIVNHLLFVVNICIFGAHEGAGILTAQYYGNRDMEGVRGTHRIKLLAVLIVLSTSFAIYAGFRDPLLRLYLHESEAGLDVNATFRYAQQYIAIMMIGLLPFGIKDIYSGTLRQCSEPFIPMVAGLVAVFVNLVGNYILIFGKFGAPALGVNGAAYATVLSRIVEMLIVVIYAHTHTKRCPYIKGLYSSFKIEKKVLQASLKLGLPMLINEMLWSFGQAFLTQSYSMLGLQVVSAMNICSNITQLFFCVSFALMDVVAINVGQVLGSGDLERAVKEDKQCIAFAVAICTVIAVFMALVTPYIPNLYNTTDAIKDLARQLLLVASCALPLICYGTCCYATLRSGGRTWVMFVFDSGFIWAFYVPVAWFISRHTNLGIVPFYAIIQGLEFLKSGLGTIMIKKRIWVRNLVQ